MKYTHFMEFYQLFTDFPDGRAMKKASGVDFFAAGANIEAVAAQAKTFWRHIEWKTENLSANTLPSAAVRLG